MSTTWWDYLERVFENQAKLINLLLHGFGMNTLDDHPSSPPLSNPSTNGQQYTTTKNVVQDFLKSGFDFNILANHGREGWNQFKSDATGFVNSVYWRDEYWLQGAIALHIVLFTCIIFWRRNMNVQGILFGIICRFCY